eukprot:gene23520-28526_t
MSVVENSPSPPRPIESSLPMYSEEEKARIKHEVRMFTKEVQESFAEIDYQNFLERGAQARGAFAVKDILTSKCLPFTTEVVHPQTQPNSRKTNRRLSIKSLRRPSLAQDSTIQTQSTSRRNSIRSTSTPTLFMPSLTSPAASPRRMSLASSVTSGNEGGGSKGATLPPLLPSFSAQQSAQDNRRVEQQLQAALALMTEAKTSLESSRCMYDAGSVFLTLCMYDRAAYCLRLSTQYNNAEAIVDTRDLPQDENYQRKVKFLSPTMTKKFFADRKILRDKLVWQEKEAQRARKMAAHFLLVRIYLLSELKDVFVAHDNVVAALREVRGEEELQTTLNDFHALIVEYSEYTRGKSDFNTHKQVLRSSAGPIADDHIYILHEMVKRDPSNHLLHEWLGKRYAEKCDFENSHKHYQLVRDLTATLPTKEEAKPLFQSPYTGENNVLFIAQRTNRLLKSIGSNINKHEHSHFGTDTEMIQAGIASDKPQNMLDWARRDGDCSWFQGKHTDAQVTIYLPPQQGWTA